MTTILVADDDAHIRKLIRLYLENASYKVIEARDGKEALLYMKQQDVSLALIDVMMPKLDGIQLTKSIREQSSIPILMITAKGESKDKINGFNAGTDDYLVKPFDPIEMTLRVKALLKRSDSGSQQVTTIGAYTIDLDRLQVMKDDDVVVLKKKECELLFHLAKFPGKIFTREQLIESIWGIDFTGDDRTVDVHIKRLREKIRHLPKLSIKTVRGLGYALEAMN
ncbi:response regulator transcription factor [Geomicrobium sp. JCM 19038]|uniref:response regulator transcription factor n=1 Tax=Geomicrobium sp. JCM 19038 TaxID=1460635 RepID=UPI00045F14C4|nr:response regulator transcription factor [Geomicrobium sp. JCM 19038]GAK07339.1 DNA-binding response regulator [Geomicrobium sp. JCM 19038]